MKRARPEKFHVDLGDDFIWLLIGFFVLAVVALLPALAIAPRLLRALPRQSNRASIVQ